MCIYIKIFLIDLDSEEESGMDWSDLEREAEEEDRNHDIFSGGKQNGKHSSKDSKNMKHK